MVDDPHLRIYVQAAAVGRVSQIACPCAFRRFLAGGPLPLPKAPFEEVCAGRALAGPIAVRGLARAGQKSTLELTAPSFYVKGLQLPLQIEAPPGILLAFLTPEGAYTSGIVYIETVAVNPDCTGTASFCAGAISDGRPYRESRCQQSYMPGNLGPGPRRTRAVRQG